MSVCTLLDQGVCVRSPSLAVLSSPWHACALLLLRARSEGERDKDVADDGVIVSTVLLPAASYAVRGLLPAPLPHGVVTELAAVHVCCAETV